MFTMRPYRCARIAGSAALMVPCGFEVHRERRLVELVVDGMLDVAAAAAKPALFTTMSRRPRAATPLARPRRPRRWTPHRCRRRPRPPPATISSTARRRRGVGAVPVDVGAEVVDEHGRTACRNASAYARPRPRPAPVTTAARPASDVSSGPIAAEGWIVTDPRDKPVMSAPSPSTPRCSATWIGDRLPGAVGPSPPGGSARARGSPTRCSCCDTASTPSCCAGRPR